VGYNITSCALCAVENMCSRYPNATEVNVYGAPAVNALAMKAATTLRYLSCLPSDMLSIT